MSSTECVRGSRSAWNCNYILEIEKQFFYRTIPLFYSNIMSVDYMFNLNLPRPLCASVMILVVVEAVVMVVGVGVVVPAVGVVVPVPVEHD